MPAHRHDLRGKTFGKWVALRYMGFINGHSCSYWWCQCECSHEKPVQTGKLLNGDSTQCRTCAIKEKWRKGAMKSKKPAPGNENIEDACVDW